MMGEKTGGTGYDDRHEIKSGDMIDTAQVGDSFVLVDDFYEFYCLFCAVVFCYVMLCDISNLLVVLITIKIKLNQTKTYHIIHVLDLFPKVSYLLFRAFISKRSINCPIIFLQFPNCFISLHHPPPQTTPTATHNGQPQNPPQPNLALQTIALLC